MLWARFEAYLISYDHHQRSKPRLSLHDLSKTIKENITKLQKRVIRMCHAQVLEAHVEKTRSGPGAKGILWLPDFSKVPKGI